MLSTTVALLLALICPSPGSAATPLRLRTGWQLASSAALGDAVTGKELSLPSYTPPADTKWYHLETFPATVLAALDEAGDAAKGGAKK